MERALVEQYVGDVQKVVAALRPEILDVAVAIAELPDMVRGFGPVKQANHAKAQAKRAELLGRLTPAPMAMAAD